MLLPDTLVDAVPVAVVEECHPPARVTPLVSCFKTAVLMCRHLANQVRKILIISMHTFLIYTCSACFHLDRN